MADLYSIFYKDKEIHSHLTIEEYFDIMEELANQFYQTGSPDPQDLKTKIIGDH